MDQMDCENHNDDSNHKKARHRKKQLYHSILQQMEFYFSDSNLSKDRFLSQLIQENPYVNLSVFLTFNKIRKLTLSLDDIRKAVSKSDVIQLSEDKESICKKQPFKIKPNVDECTVYVERIKSDVTHDWLTSLFSEFGNVVYVSIPKYRHNEMNKGFAFVEFDTEKEAQSAVEYFESIGAKMPSHINPEELCSIVTFQKEAETKEEPKDPVKEEPKELVKEEPKDPVSEEPKEPVKEEPKDSVNVEQKEPDTALKKRKHSDEDEDSNKRIKEESDCKKDNPGEVSESEDAEGKKKKKKHKKKNQIKELGIQILTKKEWKKMRNHYLDLQRKKMKELKSYLHKAKFSQQNYAEKNKKPVEETPVLPQLKFVPGVIVKLKLNEPCGDQKKLKNEIKAASSAVQFVDFVLPAGSDTVFIRFGDAQSATNFCKLEIAGEKSVLSSEEEKRYWDKIQKDRGLKFSKCIKKQRGRDKLLRKAEKELGKHIRFDEDNQ